MSNLKTISLKLTFIVFINIWCFSLFSQESATLDIDLLICDEIKTIVHVDEIASCNKLSLKDDKRTISSFTVSGLYGSTLREDKVDGDSLPQSFIAFIKEKKPKEIYFEVIQLSEGSMIKPIKLKIEYP